MFTAKKGKRVVDCTYEVRESSRKSIRCFFWQIKEDLQLPKGKKAEMDSDSTECSRCKKRYYIDGNNLCRICIDDLGGM